MKEKTLRQIHRSAGVILAFFIIIQSLSGSMLSFQLLVGGIPFGQIIAKTLVSVHYTLGPAGFIYRIILGFGILWMAFSGLWINMKIRARNVSK